MKRTINALLFSCVALGWVTAASAQDLSAQIAAAKAATAKYQDVNVALAAGYIPDPSGLVRSVNKIKDAFVDEDEVVTVPAADPGPSELDILIEIRDALAK